MTARTLFEVATGVATKARRTFQPVRRNSYDAGDRRASAIWKPIDRKEMTIAHRIRAAERYDRDGRKAGERMGPLGEIGLEVLRTLYFIVDYKTGRLEPSIDFLCSKVKRSRAAVVRALARLKDHGFLNWVRRCEPVEENEGQKGVQIKQIPNAYALTLPALALALIKSFRKAGPVPVDEQDRREAHRVEARAMEDSLPLAELPTALVADPALAEILSRVGASLSVPNANSHKSQNTDPQG